MPDARLLRAAGVRRRYAGRGGLVRRGAEGIVALDGVSLEVRAGEMVGVVGESGAGKSTLARILAGLEAPDSGTVFLDGKALDPRQPAALRRWRRAVQLVFQDPGSSLDPRQAVGAAVAEPLALRGRGDRGERAARVGVLLERVGLPHDEAMTRRRPQHLSGGERQRVAIARALACEPRVLVLDEPTSALDVSVRGHLLSLLLRLRHSQGLTMVFVTHELDLAAATCARIVVLQHGRVVEEGDVERIATAPQHPHTRALMDAARTLGFAGGGRAP
jgi:ABC-type glutathione transport system ATPase component